MTTISSNSVYTDYSSLSLLKKEAELNPESDATLREVAEQFESLFMHMMLKSMRSAVNESGLMSSDQTSFYQEMLDQQLSTELPKQGGIGLADVIVQQLGGKNKHSRDTENVDLQLSRSSLNAISTEVKDIAFDAKNLLGLNKVDGEDDRAKFIQDIVPAISAAAEGLGVKRDAIVAQAILETGWGQSVIHDSRGQSSHNLFGIKADEKWQGERVTAKTYEFIDGSLRPRYEDFRAYGSYKESVEDYVAFINNGDRYQEALKHGDNVALYAEKIQQAGYATDPEYGNKVKNIVAGETYKSLLATTGLESR